MTLRQLPSPVTGRRRHLEPIDEARVVADYEAGATLAAIEQRSAIGLAGLYRPRPSSGAAAPAARAEARNGVRPQRGRSLCTTTTTTAGSIRLRPRFGTRVGSAATLVAS